MACTRNPFAASSARSDRVMLNAAAFEIAYDGMSGTGAV
jgi:hypothetical protein